MKVIKQQIEGVLDMLGDGPDFGANGYEIMIIFPAGNKMIMEMVGDPSASDFAKIQADVDAVGAEMTSDDGATAGEQRHQPKLFCLVEIGEIGDVSPWRKQQMPVGVGKAVKEDNGQFVTK